MAKNSIRDYSATNSSNTDIQSIDISEGCSPAGINNAIREVMADLKDVSTGAVALESPSADSLTVTGDITATHLKIGTTANPSAGGVRVVTNVAGGSFAQYCDSQTNSGFTLGTVAGSGIFYTHTGAVGSETYAERLRIDSSGNVGIGTSSPSQKLTLQNGVFQITGSASFSGNVEIGRVGGDNNMGFATGGTERMRITAAGDLHLGKTSLDFNAVGVTAQPAGVFAATRDGGTPVIVNRKTSDGELVQLQKDGGGAGSIGVAGGNIYIGQGDTTLMFSASSDAILPKGTDGASRDNAIDLGQLSVNRFNDAYITNGVTTGSDQNEKQQIAALTDAEITAAKAISQLFKTFKWNDAVAEKGDAARTHTGVIAQDVQATMTAAGLDAGDYGFFISSTWWETQTEVPAVEAVEAVDAVYEDVVIPAVE